MLLEQGYGQQLLGHLQPAPLLQRAPFMPPLGRGGGTDQLSPRSTRAQQQPPPQRSVRSVYTQTPLEHMGSFEDEPGMSQAHEVRRETVLCAAPSRRNGEFLAFVYRGA